MPKVPVSEKTLNLLGDGYAGKAIGKSLDAINADLIDRGHDGKVRTLTIKVSFKPSDEGQRVAITVDATHKLPAYTPPATAAKFEHAAGGFMFQPEAAGNPDQTTLSDLEVVKRGNRDE